jgi:hypothetical protein
MVIALEVFRNCDIGLNEALLPYPPRKYTRRYT